jgi:hypothetical protein
MAHVLTIVAKVVAILFVIMNINLSRRQYNAGRIPVSYGLKPDWHFYRRALLFLAVAAATVYFVFIR